PARTRALRWTVASTVSWFPITAADPRKRDERPSRLFPKSSARSAAAFRSLSTEVFAAERMCLRRSHWEPRRWASDVHSFGDWELSGRLACTGASTYFRDT